MSLRHPRIFASALACAALALATTAADGAQAATPCLDIAGLIQVNCPGPAPAPTPPTATTKPKKAKACANADVTPSAANLRAMAKATLCLVNQERRQRRLVALKANKSLGKVATRFATRLVTGRFFDHTAPDGTTTLDRIRSSGYLTGGLRRWWVGENIAYATGKLATPKAIVAGWMASPGHRANILQSRYRDLGLGVSLGSPDGPEGATYVHDFGRRIR